jgi:hypothetical protein
MQVHGGGIQLSQILDKCDAVLDAWYPGAQGGNGVADVLFGTVRAAQGGFSCFFLLLACVTSRFFGCV